MCGARGGSEIARTILGSTSTSLLHHADLPLLVIPDDVGALEGPIVVAYDGSPAADVAIDVAGRVLPGRAALVVHVYLSQYRDSHAVQGAGPRGGGEIVQALDQALTDEATETTRRGVARAQAAGLDATGETIQASKGVWRTISALVHERGASLVLTGSRHRRRSFRLDRLGLLGPRQQRRHARPRHARPRNLKRDCPALIRDSALLVRRNPNTSGVTPVKSEEGSRYGGGARGRRRPVAPGCLGVAAGAAMVASGLKPWRPGGPGAPQAPALVEPPRIYSRRKAGSTSRWWWRKRECLWAGARRTAITYNGGVRGPTLVADPGDRVRVRW